MKTKHNIIQHQSGFTLVELLVAMVVSFIVSAAVYASYKVQSQTQKAQMQVTEIQQNLRAAMDMISRDFRIASYDPSYTGNYGPLRQYTFAGNGITYTNGPTTFIFTGDLCEDLDPPNDPNGPGVACQPGSPHAPDNLQETYLYEHYDSDGDGFNDAIRGTPGGSAIAENIEKLDFVYILNTGAQLPALSATTIDELQAIKVSILARATEPDFNYTDNKTYTYGTGMSWDPSTFSTASCKNNNCLNYRRRSLVATIELRNVGLN